jgi:hypothetical protein
MRSLVQSVTAKSQSLPVRPSALALCLAGITLGLLSIAFGDWCLSPYFLTGAVLGRLALRSVVCDRSVKILVIVVFSVMWGLYAATWLAYCAWTPYRGKTAFELIRNHR